MTIRRVLVVDDEDLIRWSLTERLKVEGHDVIEAGTASAALEQAADGVDLVVLDYTLPDGDGLSVLRKLREIDPDTLVIMLTAHRDVGLIVDAMKAGAFDYATKPFDLDDIALRVSRALETTRTRRELRILREGLGKPYGMASIIGSSEPMQRVKTLIGRIAGSPGSTVLITGESGTGKDLLAKVIHYNSSRGARPYTNITSSALPEMLMESELFGHERGAFTDARNQKQGLFEQSDGGTVFLDEIGEMASIVQAKLLRFLEERAFRRVGGGVDLHVDVRVIAATNRNLEDAVQQGKFREDLFYRLNVLRVEMPPLRVRGEDLLLLAQYFIETFSKEFRRPVRGLSPAAEKVLLAYTWPGNVREMRNLIERAVLLSDGQVLHPSDFDSLHTAHHDGDSKARPFALPESGLNLDDVEKQFVIQALERTEGNQTRAAALLGLHRDQIRYRIEKFGLVKK